VEYLVSLPEFEGPFALLLHLVEKAEVDVYDISIAKITDQYLAYLQAMKELNLEVASEFLVMAATLLKLKSKKLLPTVREETDEDDGLFTVDSQDELVQRLLEYRFFNSVSEELRKYEQAQKRVFVRSLSGEKVVLVNPDEGISASGITLPGLMQAFQRLLAEKERLPREIVTDELSVQDRIIQIMQQLARHKDGLDFTSLFSVQAGITEIIITFFALLELVRLRKVRVWQDGTLGRLTILRR
jgi:segregation and condensation protein A